MKADLLVDCANALGEGVQWNDDHQRVWWTDIHGSKLWSCDADGGDVASIETAERLGSFAFDPDNNVLAAFETGLFRWNLDDCRQVRSGEDGPAPAGQRCRRTVARWTRVYCRNHGLYGGSLRYRARNSSKG